MNDSINQVSEILQQTKAAADDILKENPSVKLLVGSGLVVLINRLSVMGGGAAAIKQAPEHTFEPIKDFLGEEVSGPAMIKEEDLNPETAEKDAFLSKLDVLYNQFDTLTPEGILNGNPLPEDQVLIRGVAKRAGLEDYETHELNSEYIERIQEAIVAKMKAEKENKAAELAIQQGQTNTEVGGDKKGKKTKA